MAQLFTKHAQTICYLYHTVLGIMASGALPDTTDGSVEPIYESLRNQQNELRLKMLIGGYDVVLYAVNTPSRKGGWSHEVYVVDDYQPDEDGCIDDPTELLIPELADYLSTHPALRGFEDANDSSGVYYIHKEVAEQHFPTAFVALCMAVQEFAEQQKILKKS